jgi:hypothetical protein
MCTLSNDDLNEIVYIDMISKSINEIQKRARPSQYRTWTGGLGSGGASAGACGCGWGSAEGGSGCLLCGMAVDWKEKIRMGVSLASDQKNKIALNFLGAPLL